MKARNASIVSLGVLRRIVWQITANLIRLKARFSDAVYMRQERLILAVTAFFALAGGGFLVGAKFAPSLKVLSTARGSSASAADPPKSSHRTASDTVATYYRAINDRDFGAAYDLLSSDAKAKSTLAQFTAGYRTTKSVLAYVAPSDDAQVATTLGAVDVTHDGTLNRKFVGETRLLKSAAGWRIDGGSFSVVSSSGGVPKPARPPDPPASTTEPDSFYLNTSNDAGTTGVYASADAFCDSVVTMSKAKALFDTGTIPLAQSLAMTKESPGYWEVPDHTSVRRYGEFRVSCSFTDGPFTSSWWKIHITSGPFSGLDGFAFESAFS